MKEGKPRSRLIKVMEATTDLRDGSGTFPEHVVALLGTAQDGRDAL